MFQSTLGKTQQDAHKMPQRFSPELAGKAAPLSIGAFSNHALLRSRRAGAMPLQPPLRPSQTVVLQRKCSACKAEDENMLQRKLSQAKEFGDISVGKDVESMIDQKRGSGIGLDGGTRKQMEATFQADFSGVRIHLDTDADTLNRAINARAFTTGQDIFFSQGAYKPGNLVGRELIAHELTHIVQQGDANAIQTKLTVSEPSDALEQEADRIAHHVIQQERQKDQSNDSTSFETQQESSYGKIGSAGHVTNLMRSAVDVTDSNEDELPTPQTSEAEPSKMPSYAAPEIPPKPAAIPSPETCPPPKEMNCLPARSSPSAVTNTLVFPQNSASLNAMQQVEIDAAASAWHTGGGSVVIRVDGYASAEGECGYNWSLSCQRAEAVATELRSPSDGSVGVPSGKIDKYAHGESDDSGHVLAPNRKATISIPIAAPSPKPPSSPPCSFPVSLGSARGCGSGTDFTHFDFPSISATSTAKLAAWAASHSSPLPPFTRGPFRSLVTDTECELEMDGVLSALAGGAGHAAFSRFAAGTGGTVTHGPSSTLGAMALVSGSFLATVALVKASIETQLAAQASSGALLPCALRVAPPATAFQFSDGTPLKAVIGGTQGENLSATSFTGSIPKRSYTIGLRFLICDDFGVDEADLYAPGLFAFWVLQHERNPLLYIPFINQLDLPVTVSGTF